MPNFLENLTRKHPLPSPAAAALLRRRPVMTHWMGAAVLASLLIARAGAEDYTAPVEKLLARMTLEEKVGQMTQVDMGALKDLHDVQKYLLGSVLSGGSSDPS